MRAEHTAKNRDNPKELSNDNLNVLGKKSLFKFLDFIRYSIIHFKIIGVDEILIKVLAINCPLKIIICYKYY